MAKYYISMIIIKVILKCEIRSRGVMTLFHDNNNNISIYHTSHSGVYQDEYGNWEFYQEINILGWLELKHKNAETVVRVTCARINIWRKISLWIIKMRVGVVSLLMFSIQKLTDKCALQKMWWLIRFVIFH